MVFLFDLVFMVLELVFMVAATFKAGCFTLPIILSNMHIVSMLYQMCDEVQACTSFHIWQHIHNMLVWKELWEK